MEERVLAPENLSELMELQDRLHQGLEQSRFLCKVEREQMQYMLSGGGYGLGLTENGKIVGAWLLYYPFDRQDSLASAVDLPPELTAHFELAMLDGAYRGRGLHGRMTGRLIEHAQAEGRFAGLAATVHPQNAPSLKGFLANGFAVVGERKMYGGMERLILFRALQNKCFGAK